MKIPAEQRHHLIDEGVTLEIMDPVARVAMREGLDRLHHEVCGRVGIAQRKLGTVHELQRQRVRQRLFHLQHARMECGWMGGFGKHDAVKLGIVLVNL